MTAAGPGAWAADTCPRCGTWPSAYCLCEPDRRCVCGAPLLSWEPPYCSAGGCWVPPRVQPTLALPRWRIEPTGGRDCRAEYRRRAAAA